MKRLFIITFLTSLILFSCSKDDSDYIKKSDIFRNTGTCKVQLTGTLQNGYSLNESLQLNFGNYNQYYENGNYLNFTVDQSSDNLNNRDYIDFQVEYNKLSKNSELNSVYISYTRILDSKNAIIFRESFSDVELSNFSFDSLNSKISGKLLFSKEYYNSGSKRTVIGTADFNVSVIKVVNRNTDY